ncbi:hypothetical protein QSJ18_15860 [Gordonia sp. ABSL1-1]|uniref:hypothetical protein n=1 Tax=Gordonia sp. ABSL1-1 TaxID=3053923 RepID=UPI00257291E1|nr:hypothetical protein [Gordonia sp. ABSL1-1]MDL9938228.1 hypothetical protein [Gordonia sp. ABSL1-1]
MATDITSHEDPRTDDSVDTEAADGTGAADETTEAPEAPVAAPRGKKKVAARSAPMARRRPAKASTGSASTDDTDISDGDDTVVSTVAMSAATQARPERNRGLVFVAAAAAVVMLALAGATAFFGYHYFTDDDAAAETPVVADGAAVNTAKDYAIKLSSFDYRDLNKNRDSIVSMSTPAFAGRYAEMINALNPIVTDGRGEATAKVSHAALENVDGNTAAVLLFVDQSARNIVTPDGKSQPYRMLVTLKHTDGRWLVDNVETK